RRKTTNPTAGTACSWRRAPCAAPWRLPSWTPAHRVHLYGCGVVKSRQDLSCQGTGVEIEEASTCRSSAGQGA
ncbi:MAG: hypothetical protein ACK55Z_04200, partial [bacterium]